MKPPPGFPTPAPRRRTAAPPGLRMQALVKAAGVPKSTILFYLQAGLLPPPVKTGVNTALYDPACIERLRLIRRLQERHRLSLAEIRRIIEGADPADITLRLELNDIIFGRRRKRPPLDSRAFCRRAGLKPPELERLLEARLLLPLVPGRFDAEDLAMGKVAARALRAGIRAEDLAYYAAIGEKIVDCEMALRNRMTGHLSDAEDAALTIEMVKSARLCRAYVIDRLFQHRVAGMRRLKEDNPENNPSAFAPRRPTAWRKP